MLYLHTEGGWGGGGVRGQIARSAISARESNTQSCKESNGNQVEIKAQAPMYRVTRGLFARISRCSCPTLS